MKKVIESLKTLAVVTYVFTFLGCLVLSGTYELANDLTVAFMAATIIIMLIISNK